MPRSPQRPEHRHRDGRLLQRRRQRAQIDHHAVVAVEDIDQRGRLRLAPDLPTGDVQVGDAQPELAGLGGQLAEQQPLHLGQRVALPPEALHELPEGAELFASRKRVELQHLRLLGAGQVAEADAHVALGLVGMAGRTGHAEAGRGSLVTPGQPLVDSLAVAQRAEGHEVGVGVEHDEAELGLEQELFQHHPEREGLAGPGLTAQEGMAVEAACPQRDLDLAVDIAASPHGQGRRRARARAEVAFDQRGARRGQLSGVEDIPMGRARETVALQPAEDRASALQQPQPQRRREL